MKIWIETHKGKIEAQLNESKSAKKLFDNLPMDGNANVWGEEIYFEISLNLEEEQGYMKQDMEIGEIAYWIPGKAFCIFFGKTPASITEKPRAASEVISLGKIMGNIEIFKGLEDGDEIRLEAGE